MKIAEIINLVKNTNSRLKKEKILKENDSPLLRKIFYYAYEPLKVFYVQNISNVIIFNGNNFEIENIEHTLFYLLDQLSNREITGNNAKEQIIKFCSETNASTFEVIESILQKDLKCGIGEKTLRKVFGEKFITDFEVQLANKYEFDKEYKVDSWIATPKLDGLRGVMNNGVLLSRNGKYLYGFNHIEEELNFLKNKYGIRLFDGEMYSRNIPFQKIQSIVLSEKTFEYKDQIKYNIFAIDLLDKKFKNTESMYAAMAKIQENNELNFISFIPGLKIKNDNDEIFKVTDTYMNMGYEGSILRHPDIYITKGRNDNLLKVKLRMKEADLQIIDVIEGKNKYKGKMGALLCKGVAEGENIEVEVGSGFSDIERAEIFDNFEKFKNKTITVKYQNLTDEKNSLRFPRKVLFKQDR